MNTTKARALNGSHIGREIPYLGKSISIVSITHKKNNRVVIRWSYLNTETGRKRIFDSHYTPDEELRLL